MNEPTKALDEQFKIERQKSYCRGYNAGIAKKWPAHKPPLPPDPLIQSLVEAATEMRDAFDDYLSQLDPDDEIQQELGEPIDQFDNIMTAITTWLRRPSVSELAPVGDNRQRYEVTCTDENGKTRVVGWINLPDGGPLVEMVRLHPSWTCPVVVDRHKENLKASKR